MQMHVNRRMNTPILTEKLAVSRQEAAALIGVSLRTLEKFIRARKIPARKIGSRTVRRRGSPSESILGFRSRNTPTEPLKTECGNLSQQKKPSRQAGVKGNTLNANNV